MSSGIWMIGRPSHVNPYKCFWSHPTCSHTSDTRRNPSFENKGTCFPSGRVMICFWVSIFMNFDPKTTIAAGFLEMRTVAYNAQDENNARRNRGDKCLRAL